MIKNGIVETSVAVKESKIRNNWSSFLPKKYQRNAILGDLHRAHNISNNFEHKKKRNKKKYLLPLFAVQFYSL